MTRFVLPQIGRREAQISRAPPAGGGGERFQPIQSSGLAMLLARERAASPPPSAKPVPRGLLSYSFFRVYQVVRGSWLFFLQHGRRRSLVFPLLSVRQAPMRGYDDETMPQEGCRHFAHNQASSSCDGGRPRARGRGSAVEQELAGCVRQNQVEPISWIENAQRKRGEIFGETEPIRASKHTEFRKSEICHLEVVVRGADCTPNFGC